VIFELQLCLADVGAAAHRLVGRIADVVGLARNALGDHQQKSDECVRNIAEGPRLRAGSVNVEWQSRLQAIGEIRQHAIVALLYAGAENIERPDRRRRGSEFVVKNVAERFPDALALVVASARSATRHVAAITLLRRYVLRLGVAVNLGGAEEGEPRVMFVRQFEHIARAGHRDF